MPDRTDARKLPSPHSDGATNAHESTSPVAAAWARELWTSPRACADLSGVPLARVEDLIVRRLVRTDRRGGSLRVRVSDVVEKAGSPAVSS